MFWDRVAFVYDIFANLINKKTHDALCRDVAGRIAATDCVLECACGTGLLSGAIAAQCRHLVATDLSPKMLARAQKKHRRHTNAEFRLGNIMNIEFLDATFDAVVAGNVIHLLDDPYQALAELQRVCRPGGTIIIPTYVNTNVNKKHKGGIGLFARLVGKSGAHFKKQFTFESYRTFFQEAGISDAEFVMVEGCVPCAIAVYNRE